MKALRVLLLAVALAAASPAIAQTTGSESGTTLTQSAANAASSRVLADDTDIPKPQKTSRPAATARSVRRKIRSGRGDVAGQSNKEMLAFDTLDSNRPIQVHTSTPPVAGPLDGSP